MAIHDGRSHGKDGARKTEICGKGFPSNPKIKEKWIEATCRGPVWLPLKRSTICSIHFEENQFRPMPKSRRLFEWAVPTLKLPQIPGSSSKPETNLEPKDVPVDPLKLPFDVNQPTLPKEIDSNKTTGSGTVYPQVKIESSSPTHEIYLETEDVVQPILTNEIDSNKTIVSGTVCPPVKIERSSPQHEMNLETQHVPIDALRKPFYVEQPILGSGVVNLPMKIEMSSPIRENDLETKVPVQALTKPSNVHQRLPVEIESNETIGSGTTNLTEQIALDKETKIAAIRSRLDESVRRGKMCVQLEKYKAAVQQKNKKIRNLQKQTSRYRQKIAHLKDIIKELQEKKIGNSDQIAYSENLGVKNINSTDDAGLSEDDSDGDDGDEDDSDSIK
ncbi:uncharacterized protein LOC125235159 isoform X2 [Leguminivora glycinivorella]|uniref:uncharacterized protein LOC125235159 isoform X2 n=1 Tax=Leguminivora glycinivorella TaxID=1035111 RepID=UPI00200F8A16|nr:uncharacterized protein LOC125235159 isoform X2 [Leguminivora glycinivorella]